MIKFLCKLYFKIIGWKITGQIPPPKCVIVAAPHTSNSDYPIALSVYYILGLRVKFLAKVSLFRFPLGILMKGSGGIPVDRNKSGKMVDYMITLFKENNALLLMIPVEGTRGLVKEWKTGFYHVAKGAGVPIALGFLDYKKKEAGFGSVFYLTGDMEKDIKEIQNFYRTITPKHPKLSSLYEG